MKDEKRGFWPKIEEEANQQVIDSVAKPVPTPKVESQALDTYQKPIVVLSDVDAYIHERMKGQPKTLEDVIVKDRVVEEGVNRLALPREIKEFEDKFIFRWLNKKKQAIDRACDVVGWTLVNRFYFKRLPDHLFTANGSIERGDTILAFIPLKRGMELREIPGKTSRDRVNNLPLQDLKNWKDRGYEHHYKPALEEERDGAAVKPGRGITIQPD